MPGTCCCVPGCKNRGGHQFPKDKTRRKAWCIAIRRAKQQKCASLSALWEPGNSSVVCKTHFLPSDYKDRTVIGSSMRREALKETAVPSQFVWTPSSDKSREKRNIARNVRKSLCLVKPDPSVPTTVPHCEIEMDMVVEIESEAKELSVQTEISAASLINTETQTTECSSVACGEVSRTSIQQFKTDQAGVQYYTGLNDYETFCNVFFSLGPAAFQLTYLYGQPTIPVIDQMFLTLMKCRTAKDDFELSRMFKISLTEVYNIFVTWIRFISLQWREIDIWPSRDLFQFYSPSDFFDKFPRTRAVFDGTEIPVKKPKAPT